MSRPSNLVRGDNMDAVDPIVTNILKAEKEYRVQGGKALISVLKPDFVDKQTEEARAHLASHDWNVIYVGDDFYAFVTKFFKALEGLYNRVSIIDSGREGGRFIKKASFIKDAGDSNNKKRQQSEPFLTISDGSAKTNAKFGRLSESCGNEEIEVGGIKYVGVCELMTRFTRMLAPDNRFLRDKGPKIVTRLRVLLQALKDKGLVVPNPDPKTYAEPLKTIKSYTHLKGVGENVGENLGVSPGSAAKKASSRGSQKSKAASNKLSGAVKKKSPKKKSAIASAMTKTVSRMATAASKAATVAAKTASRVATAAASRAATM